MQYRNARTKAVELAIPFIATTLLASLVLATIWMDSYVWFAVWIYLLIFGAFLFFLWDTRNTPHSIDLEDDQFTVIKRSGEQTLRWADIDDLLWKKVLAKRCVVGIYLKDGRQVWLRAIRPAVAEAMERRWKKV